MCSDFNMVSKLFQKKRLGYGMGSIEFLCWKSRFFSTQDCFIDVAVFNTLLH